eukprot:TRINITY_DN667_c0_g1_i6.p1 TRINITY_DN667_c0_g1~~TRINITY_DN667_c0_g1_i6.p1  ORF type:complete len:101 (-),score=21.03 TRINITY_DN667_c0_g1_i6:89-391(-)
MNDKEIFLVKPHTFMNLSGQCVSQWVNHLNLPPTNCLLVFDTMHLPVGSIRIRRKGGSGGHNGVASVLQAVSSQLVCQLRVGVGSPPPVCKNIFSRVFVC